jgi:hypothetical protein
MLLLVSLLLLALLPQVKADAAGAQIDRAAMDAAKQAGVEVSMRACRGRQSIHRLSVCAGALQLHQGKMHCVAVGSSHGLPLHASHCGMYMPAGGMNNVVIM